jgi:hypothetical protein
MRTALISPTNLLQDVQPFSSYHLILTHKVIYDSRYQKFYRERSRAGDFIFLDNSAAEKKGHSVPLKEVVLAAVLTKPSVVFLPDFMFDSHRTLEELENVLLSPHIRFMRRVLPETKIAAVVQGASVDDWIMCFNVLNTLQGIDVLGIPMLTTQVFGSRWKALETIRKRVKKRCHLLGFWKTAPLSDIERERQYDFVMGIDTSKPVRLAVEGKGLDRWNEISHNKSFIDNDHNYFDKELLKANCEGFVKLCNGGGSNG